VRARHFYLFSTMTAFVEKSARLLPCPRPQLLCSSFLLSSKKNPAVIILTRSWPSSISIPFCDFSQPLPISSAQPPSADFFVCARHFYLFSTVTAFVEKSARLLPCPRPQLLCSSFLLSSKKIPPLPSVDKIQPR
jgi:N-acyl-L-homoserine lactone synthetase